MKNCRDGIAIYAICLLAALMTAAQVLGFSQVTSALYALSFPLAWALWLRSAKSGLTGSDLLMLSLWALSAVCVLADAIVHGGAVGIGYWKKWVIFATSLSFLQAMSRFAPDEVLLARLERLCDALCVFFVAMYFLDRDGMYQMSQVQSRYLCFGMSNPQLTGMILVCLFMLQLRFLTKKRLWHAILAAALGVFVWMTRSRTAIGVMLGIALIWLYLVLGKRIKAQSLALCALIPGVFAPAYLLLAKILGLSQRFAALAEEGKPLDSRLVIWQNALKQIFASPLIGAYWEISGGSGVSQLHNSHVDTAASYGIPAAVLLTIALYCWLKKRSAQAQTRQAQFCAAAFAGVVLLGIGEAAVFSGGLGVYIFAGIFLLLAGEKRV